MSPSNIKKRQALWVVLVLLLILLAAAILGTASREGKVKITLYGAQEMQLEYGTPYEEPGAAARLQWQLGQKNQAVDVTITGEVDHTKLGVYEVVYQAVYEEWSSTVVRKVHVVDTTAPVIELVHNPDQFTVPGKEYVEEGFTATDNYDGDLTAQVVRSSDGKEVTYTVTDSSGNTATVKRTIVYKDPEGPKLTLKGNINMDVILGTAYTEPGWTAVDNVDGDVSAQVKVTGSVDANKAGTYVLAYTVTDSWGNVTTEKRTVTVAKMTDKTAPVITLKGDATVMIPVGGTFTDPGYTANDNVDGNVTSKVKVTGTVNPAKQGTYAITYTVTDAAGNKTVVYRKVYVGNQPVPPNGKVIYLTFDDGPSQYTERLLKVLAKYNVKATFFVSAQFPGYLHLLDDIVNDGHQIALHTATHNYSQIYKDADAYFADLEKIQQIVYDRTGVNTMLMRFPGGSNNTVGKISMYTLTKMVKQKGFVYFDWNVDSRDAGGAGSAAAVYNNVVNGCRNNKNSIVLMHDIKKYTVDAIEDILKWGIANGYTFATLSESSPNVQFIK
jgi:peptidoglycan/xylan/chitin deacetylase (PgdA/CDA1 family)